jgi:hypothetical protein
MAAAATAKAKSDSCVVDLHPAEHDCRRVQVDFLVSILFGDTAYSTHAVEMCGAGLTLNGRVPAAVGEQVQLRIAFPGRSSNPLEARGVIRYKINGSIGCEFWAANSYEQQFLDGFVTACARRHELRKQGCGHTVEIKSDKQ